METKVKVWNTSGETKTAKKKEAEVKNVTEKSSIKSLMLQIKILFDFHFEIDGTPAGKIRIEVSYNRCKRR